MVDPATRISEGDLIDTLQKIRELMGTMIESKELQEDIPGFRTQKGIYKPQSSDYALWIRQTLKGIYPDQEPTVLPDGSWIYRYTPEAKGGKTDLSLSTNKALFNSMKDKVPIGVFIQRETPSFARTYEVMGLAYVEKFDGTHFVIHGEPIDIEVEPMNDSHIRPFKPFEASPATLSLSLRTIRKHAFETALRRIYHGKCSLCELGFRFHGQSIGLEAAHVIPVSEKGNSGDVRNGILLCRNHHSLFDGYLWAFDEDYRVIVSEDALFRRSAENNHLLKAEGKKLPNLPDMDYDFPASEAIDFRLGKFNSFDAPAGH